MNVTLVLSLTEADRILHALINERARVGTAVLDDLISNVDGSIIATMNGDRDYEHDQFRTDAEADADALASAGHGTDEDYGGPAEDAGLDFCHED